MRFVFSLPHMYGGPDLGLSSITTFKRILVLEDLPRGLYVYDNKRKARPDPEIAKYIEKAKSMSDAKVDPKLMKLSDKDIIEMIFFPIVNESCRLLHEGIVVKASDLDIAAVSGMGFPPYRGGIMFWADSLGSKYICSRLEEWTKMYGYFFKPSAYLDERAAKGAKLKVQKKKKNPVKVALKMKLTVSCWWLEVCRGSVVRALGFMVAASPCALVVARLACEVAVHASASRVLILSMVFI
ncbi:hypothetical protein C5167_024007 [Papaver somniferum]|uniref:3-hydroxyacyl-CoA dehydrogenase C-terminal domain-containing protein n=1 Tax=Papaver somniferum TaxID=3469 RepID=A0A4Y7JRC9_PAPSO|nr:hypothetical protein C5167_024007 [Papaver somniferum]